MNKLFINYYFLNNLLCTKNHSTSHLPQESNGLPLTGESYLGLTFDIYYLENKREIRGRYETDRQTDRHQGSLESVHTSGTKRRHVFTRAEQSDAIVISVMLMNSDVLSLKIPRRSKKIV